MRGAVLVLVAVATISVSGCDAESTSESTTSTTESNIKNTIKPEGAAQTVVDVVSGQTKFKPTDVKCPSGQEAKVGVEFDCTFTGPEGPYTAHMRVTKVEGQNVEFYVESKRS
jgi:hypothetical protein